MRSASVVDVLLNDQMRKTGKQIKALSSEKSSPTYLNQLFGAIFKGLEEGTGRKSREQTIAQEVIKKYSDCVLH